MATLRNNRLRINIEKPGQEYLGSRFDWTGFITQITLDNEFTFCVPEQLEKDKGTGGLGFCNEFGIDMPIGYEQTDVGELFPKIGVGLLTKDSEADYDFFKTYSIEKAKVSEVKISEHEYQVSSMIKNNQYEIWLTKKISIMQNKLLINYTLINKGENRIKTNEYCHNFIGINRISDHQIISNQLSDNQLGNNQMNGNRPNNQMNSNKLHDNQLGSNQTNMNNIKSRMTEDTLKHIGQDQILEFPNSVNIQVKVGDCEANKSKISWKKEPEDDFYAIIDLQKGETKVNWDFYDKTYQVGVRDYSDFEISKCSLWGTTHVVSPELFIRIDLKEGEKMHWKRTYEFYKRDKP